MEQQNSFLVLEIRTFAIEALTCSCHNHVFATVLQWSTESDEFTCVRSTPKSIFLRNGDDSSGARWSGHGTNIENRHRSRELRCFSISSSTAPSKSSAVTFTLCNKHAYFPNGAAILANDFARSWTHFRRWIRRAAPREHTTTNMCLLCGAPAANTPLPQQTCRNRLAVRARRPPRSGTG